MSTTPEAIDVVSDWDEERRSRDISVIELSVETPTGLYSKRKYHIPPYDLVDFVGVD